MSKTRHITSSIHNYTLQFEDSLDFLRQVTADPEALFIVDANIYHLYSDHLSALASSPRLFVLDAIEEHKTLAYAENIFDKLVTLQPTKKTKIISLGGGITQDVSGFAASTFYRGLKWIYVPTTLLAQADSCMGSKTSLNYKSFKNILGTFYPPHQVHICAQFTNTLKEEDFYSGIGEIAKLHVMGGATTLKQLMGQMPDIHARNLATITAAIQSSLDIKCTYMDGDEFDQGKRNMLNYGHCFGHAIETATHYSIPHGQAVVIGMILANEVAAQKGHITRQLQQQTDQLFFDILKSDYKQLGGISNDVVINAMKQDKKRVGTGLPLIMLNNSYEFFKITDLTSEEADEVLNLFKSKYCS